MLKFQFENIEELKKLHYEAVLDYVKSLPEETQNKIYGSITQLSGFDGFPPNRVAADYEWLRRFILADLATLRVWVAGESDKLKFIDFHDLYGSKFSNGVANYVDAANTYNAYTLIDKMGIHVCPYCDEEYLDVVDIEGKKKRTSEFDHFFPEGQKKFPALAMCFYNLVLSGQNCNGLKLQSGLGVSPYDEDIEDLTFLSPDLPPGINMDSVNPEDCKVLLHAKRGMVDNEKVLGLRDRYANRFVEAYELLLKKQHFPEEKMSELVKGGYYTSKDQLKKVLYGEPYEKTRFQKTLQKLKKDLVGY